MINGEGQGREVTPMDQTRPSQISFKVHTMGAKGMRLQGKSICLIPTEQDLAWPADECQHTHLQHPRSENMHRRCTGNKKGVTLTATPLISLVELRGVEPLTS